MVRTLEEYALENNIPIMQKDGIEFLLDFIKFQKIQYGFVFLFWRNFFAYTHIQCLTFRKSFYIIKKNTKENAYV